MRLAWATDVHLNAAKQPVIDRFCEDIRSSGAESLLLSGDIAEADSLAEWLDFLEARLELPIFYVLGNHDFYGSNIDTVRNLARAPGSDGRSWLPAVGRVSLGDGVTLVGHDGWGDCRLGDLDDFEILTDYLAIRDLFAHVDREDLLSGFTHREPLCRKLRELGDQAAAELRGPLMEAAATDSAVLVLTHVPPFQEACWHRGEIGGGSWLPGFTCKAIGNLLLEAARACPQTRITVLCGHTHSSGYVRLLPNLDVHTGEGDYGRLFYRTLEVGPDGIRIEEETS